MPRDTSHSVTSGGDVSTPAQYPGGMDEGRPSPAPGPLPRAVVLRDGTPMVVRAGGAPGDRKLLLAGFQKFSPQSRYHRFLFAVPALSEQMLHRLVDEVDGRDHVAVVLAPADRPERPVGVARLIRYPHQLDTADIAVSVVDDWQGRGVATALLQALLPLRPVGVTRLDTEIAMDNVPALAMVRRLGKVSATPIGSGAYRVEVALTPGALAAGLRAADSASPGPG